MKLCNKLWFLYPEITALELHTDARHLTNYVTADLTGNNLDFITQQMRSDRVCNWYLDANNFAFKDTDFFLFCGVNP